MLRPGEVIGGKYRVGRKLGEGAMGSVWLATNLVTEREFALKVLLPEAAAAPSALRRFFQEAKVCGALRHPSILEIYDAGPAPELDNAPFLVMERLDGAPLDAVIRQRGALPARLVLDVISRIARGLQLAHDKGVVHRDLKPANVFLHRPGTGAIVPKVLDFGISKIVDKSPDVALTHSSTILGSPLYMSPEQLDHKRRLDGRSDVHALGLLLYECLTGRSPFVASSYNLLVAEILRGPRPLLREALPEASPALAALVERAYAIDVDARFPSAAALADALEDQLASLGGGVLDARGAAEEILGGLSLGSKAPPPPSHASTTEPHSVDADRSPSARSIAVDAQTLDSEALDETVASPEVSQAAVTTRRRGPAPVYLALALALAVGLVLAVAVVATRATRHPSPPAAAASMPAAAAAAASVAVATAEPEPKAEPAPVVVPTVASSVARGAPAAKRPPAARPSASAAPAGRPRIGESGL